MAARAPYSNITSNKSVTIFWRMYKNVASFSDCSRLIMDVIYSYTRCYVKKTFDKHLGTEFA
jgi:hypothetical protein